MAPHQPPPHDTPEQSSAPTPEARLNYVSNPELLAMVPGLTVIGQGAPLERSLGTLYPEVLYHSSDKPHFSFNEFFDHQQAPGYNKLLGVGLYCCDQELAAKYQVQRGGDIAIILPHNARMIDRSASRYSQALPAEFLQAFVDTIDASPPRPYQTFEVDNAKTRLANNLSTVLDDLLDHLDTNGAPQPSYIQSFLTDIGIDGVLTIVKPGVDGGKEHKIATFWRHDNIGDHQTWQNRADSAARHKARAQAFLTHIVKIDSVEAGTHGPIKIQESVLAAPNQLSEKEARSIKTELEKQSLITAKQGAQLFDLLSQPHIDPFIVVRAFASMSQSADKLLSAEVGVSEGYLLHEHTQAVLGQFERFFAPRYEQAGPDVQPFAGLVRTILLLQDLGKPLAVSLEGDRSQQTAYNSLAAENIVKSLPLSPVIKSLVVDLIGQDIIGTTIKDSSKIELMAQELSKLTKKHSETLPKDKIFQTIYDIYMCDASAYLPVSTYRNGQTGKIKHSKPGSLIEAAFRPITPQLSRLKLTDANLEHLGILIARTNELNGHGQ